MGISGIFKEIGPGDRKSLLALSATHQTTHARPFRLAIDTSIWLFQIQASKGGSNPALRTFYYRLLRLLTHNIHPLFVFDGPNKPTFKRNKKVGGPGVRVASVPEFLAKQLLKEFGFPWHVAPGEAEAECAVLQREGVVDAVMSEDVDTLMFGSGVTIRNWTAEGKGKVPTHVNVYRADETKAKCGLDREGMVLVAMMSGGDYIVEGIPGCGPRVACDAAKAGFGRELCEIAKRKDVGGLGQWRERLQREINTNESKFFTRKSKLVIPDDFPSREVLGYYTNPCVSSLEKVERLRQSLQWDQDIDFVALRNFTADAFDWRCISGAKKFVRNLAPAMLVRELRLRDPAACSTQEDSTALEAREAKEKTFISTIHSKRTHASTDNSLEYRISFTPMNLVPIDLSIEDEDDAQLPPGVADKVLSEADNEWATMPSSTPAPGDDGEEDEEASTTKTRGPSLYDPTQPEKLWLLADFLKMGCPTMVRLYEDGGSDPKALFKARREARSKAKGDSNANAGGKKLAGKGKKKASNDMPSNALMAYASVIKSSQTQSEKDVDDEVVERAPLRDMSPRASSNRANSPKKKTATTAAAVLEAKNDGPAFKRLSSQWLTDIPSSAPPTYDAFDQDEEDDEPTPKAIRRSAAVTKSSKPTATKNKPTKKGGDQTRIFAQFAKKDISREDSTTSKRYPAPSTPKKNKLKRPSTEEADLLSSARSQRTISSYFSPTPKKVVDVIDLLSSSPVKNDLGRGGGAQETDLQGGFERRDLEMDADLVELPASVTKRRPGRRVLKRAKTVPGGFGEDFDDDAHADGTMASKGRNSTTGGGIEVLDLAGSSSPVKMSGGGDDFPAPSGVMPVMPSVSPPPFHPLEETTHFSPPPTEPRATASLRRSPRSSLQRSTSLASSTLVKDKHNKSKERTKKPKKKQFIQLRESLEGAWKFVDAEKEAGSPVGMLDLTGRIAGGVGVHGQGKMRRWRESGVEVLDLTGV